MANKSVIAESATTAKPVGLRSGGVQQPRHPSSQAVRQALEACPILAGLHLEPHMAYLKKLRARQIISDSINGIPACGILISGSLDVYNVAADGHEICLNRLRPGDCFGLANLFDEGSLKTVLKSRQSTEVLLFPKHILIDACKTDSQLANRLLRFYSSKVDFLLQRIELLTMHSACSKLVEYLLDKANSQCRVELDSSRECLACQLGVSRAALYREFSRLQQLNLIEVHRRHIDICDPWSLERFRFEN